MSSLLPPDMVLLAERRTRTFRATLKCCATSVILCVFFAVSPSIAEDAPLIWSATISADGTISEHGDRSRLGCRTLMFNRVFTSPSTQAESVEIPKGSSRLPTFAAYYLVHLPPTLSSVPRLTGPFARFSVSHSSSTRCAPLAICASSPPPGVRAIQTGALGTLPMPSADGTTPPYLAPGDVSQALQLRPWELDEQRGFCVLGGEDYVFLRTADGFGIYGQSPDSRSVAFRLSPDAGALSLATAAFSSDARACVVAYVVTSPTGTTTVVQGISLGSSWTARGRPYVLPGARVSGLYLAGSGDICILTQYASTTLLQFDEDHWVSRSTVPGSVISPSMRSDGACDVRYANQITTYDIRGNLLEAVRTLTYPTLRGGIAESAGQVIGDVVLAHAADRRSRAYIYTLHRPDGRTTHCLTLPFADAVNTGVAPTVILSAPTATPLLLLGGSTHSGSPSAELDTVEVRVYDLAPLLAQ